MSTYTNGRYLVEIIDQGFETSAVKNTPAFFLQFRVLQRYQGSALQDCPQFERTYRQYLANTQGLQILQRDLATLGVQFNDLTDLDLGSEQPVSLIGHRVDLTCTLELYQSREVERWGVTPRRAKLDLSAVKALGQQLPVRPRPASK
ncbi:MAG: hypothetical protein JNM56_27260 [Planctomycetia bacterium]|nr:hypothetical protein [Planctomycetia bacterium]